MRAVLQAGVPPRQAWLPCWAGNGRRRCCLLLHGWLLLTDWLFLSDWPQLAVLHHRRVAQCCTSAAVHVRPAAASAASERWCGGSRRQRLCSRLVQGLLLLRPCRCLLVRPGVQEASGSRGRCSLLAGGRPCGLQLALQQLLGPHGAQISGKQAGRRELAPAGPVLNSCAGQGRLGRPKVHTVIFLSQQCERW